MQSKCKNSVYLQCGEGECRLFNTMNSTLKSLHSPSPYCKISLFLPEPPSPPNRQNRLC